MALVLGATLIPVATELTCYYYAVLAIFGLLWRVLPSSGVFLTGFAALSSIVPAILSSDDVVYVVLSALALLCVIAINVHVIIVTKRQGRELLESDTDSEMRTYQIAPEISEAITKA